MIERRGVTASALPFANLGASRQQIINNPLPTELDISAPLEPSLNAAHITENDVHLGPV